MQRTRPICSGSDRQGIDCWVRGRGPRSARNDGLQQRRVRGPYREGKPERDALRDVHVGQAGRGLRRYGRGDGDRGRVARHKGRRHGGALAEAVAAVRGRALSVALVGLAFHSRGVMRVLGRRRRRRCDRSRGRDGRVHRAAEKVGWLGERSREPDAPKGDQDAGPERTSHEVNTSGRRGGSERSNGEWRG